MMSDYDFGAGVERLVLGTAQLSSPYGLLSSRERDPNMLGEAPLAVLALAQSLGIGAVDTAPVYGSSEELVGASGWSGPVWTKLDPGLQPVESVQRSLARLRRQQVDTVFVHSSATFLSQGVQFTRAVRSLRGEFARNLGLSAYEPDEVAACLAVIDFDVIQVPLNVFDTRFVDLIQDGTLPRDVTYVGRSVFLQGILAQPESALALVPPDLRDDLNSWIDLCRRIGIDPGEVALTWALSQTHFSSIIIGAEDQSQLSRIARWSTSSNRSEILATVQTRNLWPSSDPRRWSDRARVKGVGSP